VLNQPEGAWWTTWGIGDPYTREADPKTLKEYDPTLNILGRISQQKDLTAARNLAAAPLEPSLMIEDADKAAPLTWMTRGNGGTYASLLVAPDWPDSGTVAGSVINLATIQEKGHEEEAAVNADEIMKTVAWWNDKGRGQVDKFLRKGNLPDLVPGIDILPRQDQAPGGTADSEHFVLELGPGLVSGLLSVARMYIPAMADADATATGTGRPNKDPATGRIYLNIGGRDVTQFLRTFAMNDSAWTQLAVATRAYRQLLFGQAIRHSGMAEAIVRAGYLEGNLIAAYGTERTLHEELTKKEFEDAQKHLTLARDLGSAVLNVTPAANLLGVTDAYSISTGLALDKVKYGDYEKNMSAIEDKYSTYSDQLYVDLARGLELTQGTHTGNPTMDAALLISRIGGYDNRALIDAAMNHGFPFSDGEKTESGRVIVSNIQNNVNQNKNSK
jgi:hypothetical protein